MGTVEIIEIQVASARLRDAIAMQGLFAPPIPNADELRKILTPGEASAAHAYQPETRCARFVLTDGATVEVFTVTNVSADQAAHIAAACGRLATWSRATFIAAVERATGFVVAAVH